MSAPTLQFLHHLALAVEPQKAPNRLAAVPAVAHGVATMSELRQLVRHLPQLSQALLATSLGVPSRLCWRTYAEADPICKPHAGPASMPEASGL